MRNNSWVYDSVLFLSSLSKRLLGSINRKSIWGWIVNNPLVRHSQTPQCPSSSAIFNGCLRHTVYYYNFGWKDYSHGTLDGLLDAVKVLTFALTQGKVAVHCHAGLGRTGVLLASYLVYSPGHWRAMDAIRHVRLMRPNALQTSSQLAIVQQFEHYLLDFSSHFASRSPLLLTA